MDKPSLEKCRNVELWYEWLIKFGSPRFVEEFIFCVDDMLEQGFGILKSVWFYETRNAPNFLRASKLPERLRSLIVDGEERPLRQWDFVHCPAGTEHVFVGAGDEPCVVLMVGERSEDERLFYPASELAAQYGASAEEATPDPKQAYAPFERSQRAHPSYWDRLPWG